MSGECEKCGEHTMDCRCSTMRFCKRCKNEKFACTCLAKTMESRKKVPKEKRIEVSLTDLMDLIHWARRYCDKRATYAPSSFNNLIKRIRSEHESVIMADTFDQTLKEGGLHWPFAQDGMYDSHNGAYDATK